MRGLAMVLTELLTLARPQRVGIGRAVLQPPPTEQQVQMFTTIEMLGLAIISLIGLLTLRQLWSHGSLLVAQGLDRVELGGFAGWVDPEEHTDRGRDPEREHDRVPGEDRCPAGEHRQRQGDTRADHDPIAPPSTDNTTASTRNCANTSLG